MKSYILTVSSSLISSLKNDDKRKAQLGKITGQEQQLVAAYQARRGRGRRSIRINAAE